jgi:prepilin-type N-terminal cleavage/methylation domain-containing protein
MNKTIKQAFTLIELLVVIAIIGILSGLIVVSMGGMTTKATIAKAQVFSNSLRNSLLLNLVSEWKFDGSASDGSIATNDDVLDTWGSVNNGNVTAHQPTTRAGSNCVSGSCLQFDGVDDWVDFGGGSSLNFDNTDDFTFSVWVKDLNTVISNGSVTGLLLKNTSMGIDYYPYANQVRAGIRNSVNGTQTVDYNLGSEKLSNWTYIVFTYKTESLEGIKIYTNGLFRLSKSTIGLSSFSSATHLTTGYGILGGNHAYFNGLVDDVRVFDAAIPDSQIKEQYYAGLNSLLTNGNIDARDYEERINSIALK